MASKIKAIGALRPRIEQGKTAQKPDLLRAASRATGLVEGTLDLSIREMRDQIIEFCRAGRAVKNDGLGVPGRPTCVWTAVWISHTAPTTPWSAV
jgi:hypothetical protein